MSILVLAREAVIEEFYKFLTLPARSHVRELSFKRLVVKNANFATQRGVSY